MNRKKKKFGAMPKQQKFRAMAKTPEVNHIRSHP
jgi:hypothetical protein